jgi:hypothetical protein
MPQIPISSSYVMGELGPIFEKIYGIGGKLDVGDPKGFNQEVEISCNHYTTKRVIGWLERG